MTRLPLWLTLFGLVACTADPDDDRDDDTDDDTDAPADTDGVAVGFDPDVAPVTQGTWWRPPAFTTWHWQLQGTIDRSYEVDVYDVDLFDTPQDTIRALHDEGRKVLCYLSAGSWEEWREDAADFGEVLRGNTLDGYDDERWFDVTNPALQAPMAARLDLAVRKGCDGVEPDNVTAYHNDTGFTISARDQLAFNRWLYNAAHERGLAVFLKNDTDQADELVAYVDGTVNEQCHEYDECDTLDAFQAAGKPILNAEFAQAYRDDPQDFCARALIAGTRSLVLDVELDNRFVVNCDTDFPSTTRLADTLTYTTYYQADGTQIDRLSSLDLAIVQPVLSGDAVLGLGSTTKTAVYLSIGEIGLSNTYWVDGEQVFGQVIYDAHPEWFRARNPYFDSYFADTNAVGWQDFVLDQAAQLLARGYDGIFMDTVDTVDVYPELIPGMVTLIARLRDENPDAIIIQNRGMNVIPQTGPDVDALMFEVFNTTYNYDLEAYTRTDVDAPGYPEIVRKAVDYRLQGGVVLSQDFGEPGEGFEDLACYARDRARSHLFVPAIADKFFQYGALDYPEACPWPVVPRWRLSVEPGVVHVPLEGVGEVQLTLVGEAGFDGSVTLTQGTAPSGLSAALDTQDLTVGEVATLTLSDLGMATPGVHTLSLTGGGAGPSRTLEVQVVVHDETVWVANAGLSNLVAFDEPADLQPPALADRVSGTLVRQPYAVAVAPDGARWVVENVGDPAAAQPAGALLRYAPFDLSEPDLVATDGLLYPTGVAVADNGDVWVASSALDWTGTVRGTPALVRFDGTSTTASAAFEMPKDPGGAYHLGYPKQLAVSPSGDLWLTTTYGLAVGFHLPQSGPVAVPFAVLAGGAYMDTMNGLTFSDDGTLWLTGTNGGSTSLVMGVLPAAWSGVVGTAQVQAQHLAALRTEGLFSPWGLGFDRHGDLWVVNSTDAQDDGDSRGSLVRFLTPASRGAEPPVQTVSLASRYTLGMAVGRP